MSTAGANGHPEILRFFICGVGGLGTLMTARLIAESSLEADIDVVASEVHGMSQRGGSVQTSVLVGGAKSPLVADGAADVFIGLEPLEALRYRSKIGPETTVVVNSERVVPVTVTMGGPPYPKLETIVNTLEARAGSVFAFNATEMASELGSPRAANVAILGAMWALRPMPFGEDTFFDVLTKAIPPRFLEINRRAFAAGSKAVLRNREERTEKAGTRP